MVSYMRSFLHTGLPKRVSSVVIASVCILCTFPQPATCSDGSESNEFVSEVAKHIGEGDSDYLIERFDKLEETIELSGDHRNEGRRFLQSFIEEINTRYGLNLTIHDACLLVRENLHTLQLPDETQNLLLETIALLESDASPTSEQIQHFKEMANPKLKRLNIFSPSGLGWLGSYKKSRKSSKHRSSFCAAGTNRELPSSVYTGGVEALAGALVFTLGIVFPPAYGAGSALMVDGARRVLNGLEEADRQRPPGSDQSPGFSNTRNSRRQYYSFR